MDPEISLNIDFEEIVAKPRILKATWTFETEQDLRAQLNDPVIDEMVYHIQQELLEGLRVPPQFLTPQLEPSYDVSFSMSFNAIRGLYDQISSEPRPTAANAPINWLKEGF